MTTVTTSSTPATVFVRDAHVVTPLVLSATVITPVESFLLKDLNKAMKKGEDAACKIVLEHLATNATGCQPHLVVTHEFVRQETHENAKRCPAFFLTTARCAQEPTGFFAAAPNCSC